MYESLIPLNPKTINAMLPKLGDLLMLLNVSSDENILPTTYGELRPPLGKHHLKPSLPAAGRRAPRLGNLGHITQISNKLVQLGNTNSHIQAYLQENSEWNDCKVLFYRSVIRLRTSIDGLVGIFLHVLFVAMCCTVMKNVFEMSDRGSSPSPTLVSPSVSINLEAFSALS